MDHGAGYLVLAAAGVAAGVLNVVAGGGSFLTLPILIFLGLPAGVANATNRLGILTQNLAAVWSFDRAGVLDRRALVWAALPATVGAGLGSYLAVLTSDQAFQRLLAFLMLAFAFAALVSPDAGARPAPGPATTIRHPLLAAGFFGIGIYAGFVQAGVGFLVLAVLGVAGIDLVRGNAVKVLALLAANLLALASFAAHGLVRWPPALALAAGTALGGVLGARLTVAKGHRWVRRAVMVMAVAFAVRLWLTS